MPRSCTKRSCQTVISLCSSETVLTSSLVGDCQQAFTLGFRKNLDLEEYKNQAKFFLNAGVDHYLSKVDHNMGITMLNNMLYFSERPDLECRPFLLQVSAEAFLSSWTSTSR